MKTLLTLLRSLTGSLLVVAGLALLAPQTLSAKPDKPVHAQKNKPEIADAPEVKAAEAKGKSAGKKGNNATDEAKEKADDAAKDAEDKVNGADKQAEKKAEQPRKELDKGSEKGQQKRAENSRKWWKFWGRDAAPESPPAK